jgi:hypothetical protein
VLESTTTVVRDVEDHAALAEREAQERVSTVEEESTAALASAHGEAEDLAQRVALLEGELAVVCQSRDMTKEKSRGWTDAVADIEQQLEESKKECQEQVEELTLLEIRGSKLCLAVVGPLRVRSHLSEGMWVIALYDTEMAGELATLRVTMSSVVEFALEHSPKDTF